MGPQVAVPGGGHFRTVIHYGPWQCRPAFMRSCESKCAATGNTLMGCIWLADIKMDFEGPVVHAGSRYGVTHCCCNYPPVAPAATRASRSRWNNIRDTFRREWAKRMGAWPSDAGGTPWQGHHVFDLGHGGNPVDWDNVIPLPQDLHQYVTDSYGQCYAGTPPWNSVGVDYPYGE
ncbi:hypothetical protein D7X55_26545 [Corallococcus sp. AB049A]|uniref:Uncharacterized protein n=2 Tax=Myxococcaceae TaxID=31 RepID=A0A3A8QLC4_9BACT|nr:hypothetical protein D7Y23_11230 [Corallococcus sp. AB050B]RKH69337.1 hypothetical protein D7X96_15170 [Corallococcus interemptor]RKI58887.1 hypothetical protein D7X55_26545 [Corallococcus sp. AB049A]